MFISVTLPAHRRRILQYQGHCLCFLWVSSIWMEYFSIFLFKGMDSRHIARCYTIIYYNILLLFIIWTGRRRPLSACSAATCLLIFFCAPSDSISATWLYSISASSLTHIRRSIICLFLLVMWKSIRYCIQMHLKFL